MGRTVCVLAALALAFGGCGGDDGDAPATGASGATGAAGNASYDITVGEFLVELQPDKQRILGEFVADSEACAGVRVDNGFVLLVSAEAIDADPGSPLPDLVESQC